MKARRRLLAALALTVTAGLLAACTDDSDQGRSSPTRATTAAPSAAGSPPGPAAGASAAPIVVQQRAVDAAGDRLTVGVEQLVRQGETVVLTVRTRLDRALSGPALVSRHFSSGTVNVFDGARLVDPAGRRVWPVAEDAAGDCVCTGSLRLDEGETQPLQAAFASVPAGVGSLSVMLPYAGVFADVPIVSGAVPAPASGRDIFGRSHDPLEASAAVARSAGLEAYTERLDVGLRSRRTVDEVDLQLSSDVLFRLDSAELTGQARRTLDAAVADLRAAGPGPLSVTGHTDDSGTTAHNETLSRQRAEAVAAALQKSLPADKWPKTVVAKGESAPEVPNDSAGHRARNRRVTVTAKARANTAAQKAPDAPLPTTTGKVAAAGKGADVRLPLGRGAVRFTAGDARVVGAFAQVDLIATNTGGRDATILDQLGQSVFTARDEFDPYAPYGAAGVRMIAGGTIAYGLDYQLRADSHLCLCDRLLNRAIPPGSSQLIALWFPAPPPGTTTVTLDVPGTLRLTGVPVRT